MASRRLDIGSLLNDDDDHHPVPEPVLLAPHLVRRPQHYLGLDALVHAASEERRRLEHPEPPRAFPRPRSHQQEILEEQRRYHQQQLERHRQQQFRKSDPGHLPPLFSDARPPKRPRYSLSPPLPPVRTVDPSPSSPLVPHRSPLVRPWEDPPQRVLTLPPVSAIDDPPRHIDNQRHPPRVWEHDDPDEQLRIQRQRERERDKMRVELGLDDERQSRVHQVIQLLPSDQDRPKPEPPPERRRSPPGSLEGRAKAARRTELPSPKRDNSVETQRFAEERPSTAPAPEPLPGRLRPAEKEKEKGSHPLPRPPKQPSPPKEHDAHEWLLEHYAGSKPPPTPPPKPPTPTPEAAADALEQELEEILLQPESKPDLDADVDKAVTDLVAETLEEPPKPIEVDVEDELLSLVDDRPQPPPPPRRVPSAQRPKPPALVSDNDSRQPSPSAIDPTARQPTPTPERSSMPPPAVIAARSKDDRPEEPGSNSKKPDRASSASAAMKKKPPPKPKAVSTTPAAKPRGKPGPKPKTKHASADSGSAAVSKGPSRKGPPLPASRSRSASVMPGGSVGPEGEAKDAAEAEEGEDDAEEDDKFYCVCKTRYDEDRIMIACDRCDEWYHTQCVNMPDVEVDLVDQFICPPCIEKNPHLSLRTTYKKRCLFGEKHANPSSPSACHKPARGAFSKYCSDECGYKYMQTRIDAWAKKGGKKDKLWESVKGAEKREGVVMYVDGNETTDCKKPPLVLVKPSKGKTERELGRLRGLLDQVVYQREMVKKGTEVVVWRERLLELASERAEQVGLCGWDQRLCFGDEEWCEFGEGVLESYGGDGMQVDGAEGDGEWWCPGTKKCDRHAGWQAVRHKDVSKEREKKEELLSNLTKREREIRKRIEDLGDPHSHTCEDTPTKPPPLVEKLFNGHAKPKVNGDTRKGKKRKVPTS